MKNLSISSFKDRMLSSYKIEVEKTKNSILKNLFTNVSSEMDEEMKSFVNASVSFNPTDDLNVKILNLFISCQGKYILINFDNKNIIIKNEDDFIDFIQKMNISISFNEGYEHQSKESYISRINLNDEPSKYYFTVYISKLTSNKNQNALILNININSLFQKILIITYYEFQSEIKKLVQKKLPTVG